MADTTFRRAQWTRFGGAALALWLGLGGAPPARAQQVEILDVTYTATNANTNDSHYPVDPNANNPADWTSPVNYTQGKIHVHFEVLSKPSAQKTLLNICFIGMANYACMPYPTAYTAVGSYEFEAGFDSYYQHDLVDWNHGIQKIQLILKDENQVKKQGDPAFYPTMMRVQLTLVPQGTTFVPPLETPDAGMDAAMAQDAAMPDAAVTMDAGTPVQVVPPAKTDAGKPPVQVPAGGSGGASMMPTKPAGSGGTSGQPMVTGSGGASSDQVPVSSGGDDGGCSVLRVRAGASASMCASVVVWCMFTLAMLRRRRAVRRAIATR